MHTGQIQNKWKYRIRFSAAMDTKYGNFTFWRMKTRF